MAFSLGESGRHESTPAEDNALKFSTRVRYWAGMGALEETVTASSFDLSYMGTASANIYIVYINVFQRSCRYVHWCGLPRGMS